MRLIGTFNDEQMALTFSRHLQRLGIQHQIEIKKDTDWGSLSYGSAQCELWLEDEDHLEEVLKLYHQFLENPQNASFNAANLVQMSTKSPPPFSPYESAPPPPPSKLSTWEKQPMGWMTRGILAICIVIFFLSQWGKPSLKLPENERGLVFIASPVEKALLYDYPKFYELLYQFLRFHEWEELKQSEDLPIVDQYLVKELMKTPVWPGYYQLLLTGGWKDVKEGLKQYPTFEKIRKGQVWRLFSPILLHGDIFHLLFNMMWLIVLGKQIEQRLQPRRYLFFILIIAAISNTAQYLMSGSNFLGFSGVLCGMLAFIWVRQKKAAWEGYQIDRMTLIFMLIFVLGMAGIQFLSFFIEKTFDKAMTSNLANMAHLSGGIVGYILGKINFFSWRHS